MAGKLAAKIAFVDRIWCWQSAVVNVFRLFVLYLHVALKENSPVQEPEKLHRERALVAVVVLLAAALAVLTWVDLPILERLTSPHYIEIHLD